MNQEIKNMNSMKKIFIIGILLGSITIMFRECELMRMSKSFLKIGDKYALVENITLC